MIPDDKELIEKADALNLMMKSQGWAVFVEYAQVQADTYMKQLLGAAPQELDGVQQVLFMEQLKGRVSVLAGIIGWPTAMIAQANELRQAVEDEEFEND